MSTRHDIDFEGILLVDKPQGITSHDVVDRLRRKLRMKKIGHAGTLDPLATGLLIMLVGKATKVSQFLISLDKAYEGTFLLGVETDSQDADGKVVAEKPLPNGLTEEMMLKEMAGFLGDQYQTPPMFSAKKIDGVPLYKMARKGKTVEREPRFIRINELKLENWESPVGKFFMDCSKGTYVRTVVHDLGQRLGCGAHLQSLRRTKIDQFEVSQSLTLEQINEVPLGEVQKTSHASLRSGANPCSLMMERVFDSIVNFGNKWEKGVCLAVGMFDGVHCGHRKVLDLAIEEAQSCSGTSVALSFPQHPASYLRPGKEPPLLMPSLDKAQNLLDAGMDAVILQPFDQLLSSLEAEQFLPYLREQIPVLQSVSVGENFRFGKK